ncbi:MAG TPA: UDP-N-acetylmuramate--L-alanine ligase [Nitrospinota bacterium]|nr:UDP-N-acetylmuramate--L-alanine ligase [Nitrospinota bacterium]
MFRKTQHIHFVGIGGIGMSGIAELLLNLNYAVSGSDIKDSDIIERLRRLGASIFIGHNKSNIKNADVVVYSSAVNQDNIEIKSAKENLIPVIRRAEILAELMRIRYGIAVAGSHGKTTTTSLIATVLAKGGLDPTVVIGGKLNSLGSNAKLGQGDFLVAEADESDGSFTRLTPTIAIVTTIDKEHMDHYKSISKIKEGFLKFINKVPFYGLSILCLDQKYIQELIPKVEKRCVTYGVTSQADYIAKDITYSGLKTSFNIFNKGKELGEMVINMPGLHNVYNSLATVAVGLELDIKFEIIKKALKEFGGIQRRFEIKGETNGIIVVDDYGHHPTEIRAVLKASKEVWKEKRMIVVFQPHRYTRTQYLLNDFFTAFNDSDELIITDIYSAGEEPIENIDSRLIYEGVKKYGHKSVFHIRDQSEIVDFLMSIIQKGDLILTLGAGNISSVGDELLSKLGAKKNRTNNNG